jgi:hypothetical protein
MLYEANLSQEYWCLGIQHAVYLKNRIPTAALPYGEEILTIAITLYEAYKGTVPKLTSLQVFGYAAFSINTKEKHLCKFDSRVKLGYIFIEMVRNNI